jgi:hypothetical protein
MKGRKEGRKEGGDGNKMDWNERMNGRQEGG